MTKRALVLLPLLVAGCFGGEAPPNEIGFQATGGSLSLGWAYDGTGLAPASGSLSGQTRNDDNTGEVRVGFTLGSSTWAVTFDRFVEAEGRTFQDGGVAHGLDEHGDTGVADASVPRIHALVAAWGSARVERDGRLETPEPWTAHLMVSRDTVRGADGLIAKADGATPYDPNAPGDARRTENDPQVIFWIKHPQGETFQREPAPISVNLDCQGPQCSQTAEIPIEDGASLIELTATIAASGPLPLAVGRGSFEVVDANGAAVVPATEFTVTPGGAPTTIVGNVPGAGIVGPLTVRLAGDGAYAVQIAGAVTYDDVPFIVITWDEVALT